MKINSLLTATGLLTVGVSTECARSVVSKISELVYLLALFAAKFAAGVSLYTWLASAVLVLARTAIWDGRVVAFVVLHAATWFAKILLFAAVCGGQAR